MGLTPFSKTTSFYGIRHSSLHFPVAVLAFGPCSGQIALVGAGFHPEVVMCDHWGPRHVMWAAGETCGGTWCPDICAGV